MIGCKPLTQNEIDIILKSMASNRDKALFTLLLYTGFRITEVLNIKVSDVLNKDRLTVARKNMKGKVSSRTVLLHSSVKSALKTWIKEQNLKFDDFVFKSRKGKNSPLQRAQAWRILKSIVDAQGLQGKIALHSTRKTFADRMYKKLDKDLIKTSKALGHKNINSTVSYLSFHTEELDNAIEGFDE